MHEVVDDALGRARAIAHEMAAMAPVAIAQAKRAIYEGSDTDLTAGLAIEGAAFLETMLTDDAVRAMKTYIDLPFEQRRAWLEHPTVKKGQRID
ncbi:MAG: hypothetical protein HYR72_19820 [Deltaproteobacteria bacterium]|nr:hypothetical protein [Deltaproteobacteria bacterium]MBI3387352.1 hypothetical protein [Deltaproteobacteria bacterium]